MPRWDNSNSVTFIDVDVKGFLYGERDIWRPGDAIYLTFILQDRNDRLPADYPVTLEFFDPRGNKQRSITNTTPAGPRFFCAPAYTSAVRAIGWGRDIISELASTTRLACAGHSARRWPCTVSFEHTCR